MTLTRRQLLMAAVAAPTASGQSDHSNFVITSDSGLRLERHGDPQRPSIALYLPDAKHPSAIIEMPEHAWRKKKPAEEQSWFYRMYTSDPSLRGEVSWLKQGNALSYSMKTPSGFSLNSRATLEKDGVAISHQVTSVSELTWAMVEAPTCVKLYRPFTDVFLERTYVPHPYGLQVMASETPERLAKNAAEWLPCRYTVNCGRNA